MNPYSHILIAKRLEPYIHPSDRDDYYWGAIAPDIRYLAHLPREKTHLHKHELQTLYEKFPHRRSFLQGYQVHCLLDYINTQEMAARHISWPWASKVFQQIASHKALTILFELHLIQKYPQGERITGQTNEILSQFAITEEQIKAFLSAMHGYLDHPRLNTALYSFQQIGILDSDQIHRYQWIFQAYTHTSLTRSLLSNWLEKSCLEIDVTNYALDWLKPRPKPGETTDYLVSGSIPREQDGRLW